MLITKSLLNFLLSSLTLYTESPGQIGLLEFSRCVLSCHRIEQNLMLKLQDGRSPGRWQLKGLTIFSTVPDKVKLLHSAAKPCFYHTRTHNSAVANNIG